nr:unnamed protein product [Callosobruchus analis]
MSLNDEEEFQRSSYLLTIAVVQLKKAVTYILRIIIQLLLFSTTYLDMMLIKDIALGMNGRVDLPPTTKERYKAVTKNINDSLVSFRFIDSFKFMNSSLDKLSSYLTEYPIVKSGLLQYNEEHIKLLTKNGVYPYDFTDSFDKSSYPHLPSQGEFFNRLEGRIFLMNNISMVSMYGNH